ncbi:HugZ family protein [Ruegeria sp.]|uniref:HugZ family pyridoxamine 5'-phosphate oxidase n=1 Tax=Ruegeria sp. TaxID=1879320 RepID=UPI003C7A84BE
MTQKDPFRPVDDSARILARDLLSHAHHAALAILRPETATPSVTRIALATDALSRPISLISTLAEHTRALQANPACALLIGEPGDKGDPLTHPRLTLHCTAQLIDRDSKDHATLRDLYLSKRPKARLYADFADFSYVCFDISSGLLNGGFGKAWRLAPGDL